MTRNEHGDDPAPISYPVVVSKLPPSGLAVRFETSEAERSAVAALLDILSVDALEAEFLVEPWQRDGLKVTGTVRAAVVQACVVSLDPVPLRVREDVDLLFVPRTSKLARIAQPTGELVLDPEGADVPDVFDGDRIDLGAAVMEAVALGLDPYPRAPDVEFGPQAEEGDSYDRASPFAALRQLRPENDSNGRGE